MVANWQELAGYDATTQAELVRRREVQPVDLVDAAIAGIELLNPRLNAVITPLFDQARMRAASAALADGPFRGVPLLLKDFLCHTAGDPYYEGMRFLRDLGWRETNDTYLAAKFQAAGFVVLGKTNLPELATLPITESAAFGAARNPWNSARTPGGSSGGSAAAVAAGLVPVAHGNDGTGSLRIPASACGLVGLKPSRGRTSAGPGRIPGLLGNIVEHVVTRTVRDTAAVLDAVAGPMPGDWWVAAPRSRSFASDVGRAPGRLRVGFLVEEPLIGCPVHAECVAAVHRTARALESLGHVVEEAGPPALRGPTGLGPAYVGVIAASSTAAALDTWSARTERPIGPQDVEPHIWARAEEGRTYTAVQVHAAVRRIAAGVGRVPEWWVAPGATDGEEEVSASDRITAHGFHLLLTPTMAQPPPPIGLPLEQLGTTFGLFTLPFSYTGQPAISLPVHWTPEGLPVGVQLVAGFGREDVLLRVAAQLEEALPWRDRLPSLHASAR